jgi:hypothetical protein
MQTKDEQERPLKWFVLPNESYKWDFILEQYAGEDSQREATAERRGAARTTYCLLV